MKIVIVLFSLVGVSLAIPVVDELEVDAYLGRWYQVYGNAITWINTGPESVCNVADYWDFDADNSRFRVRNHSRMRVGDGTLDEIEGFVLTTNETGKLEVQFTSRNITGRGSYWVMDLGPKNEDDLYDYSLVSDSSGLFLFILARDIERYDAEYREQTLEFVRDAGFTDELTSPIRIQHPSNCQYLPDP